MGTPIRKNTRDMLDMLPQWLAMQKDESNGAQFLDTIGRQLDDIDALIEAILNSAILIENNEDDLDKVNIMSIDYLYRFKPHYAVTDMNNISVKTTLFDITYYPTRSKTIYEFYKPGSDKYYLDLDTGMFYFKTNYDSVTINGAQYDNNPLNVHHVWNALDEIGLLFGCPRLVGSMEKNDEYRVRLLDVFKNKGNASGSGLRNYIARSLGIEREDVKINSLDDDDFVSSLINEDGTLKSNLKEYISISRSVNGFGVNTYWETLDQGSIGLKYLPMIWDLGLDKWNDSRIQNGIGDTDDLEIIAPSQESLEQKFKYNLYAEGLLYPDRKIYPEHRFKYKVYATGKKYDDGYAPEPYKYTVTASDLILLSFEVMANKLYQHEYRFDYSKVNNSAKSTVTMAPGVNIAANPNSYVVSNVKLTDGKFCTNQPRRYVQVLANMESDTKRLKTPVVRNITVNYSAGGANKSVKIQTVEDIIRIDENNHIAGFEANTWWDQSPLIRVKNDTNDTYNMNTHEDGTITLGHGDYQKIYNSRGDWDDGMSNSETKNVTITSNGTLKLGNMGI